MDKRFSLKDLKCFLILKDKKTQKKIKKAIKHHEEGYFKLEITEDGEYQGEFTIAKNCPLENHLCEWQPGFMGGTNCGFYNGYKERCVYPRTCTHNTHSEHFVNLYDTFTGNIHRYWDVSEEQKASNQILKKCEEIGDKEWAYAEFKDDGKIVRLAELGIDKDISKIIEKRERVRQKAREQKESELNSLLKKYFGNKDIERIVELTKQLCD